MAAITTILAVGAIGMGGYSTYQGVKAGKEANRLNQQAAGEERQARSEQGALNAQRSAQERRQQVREERIARGKLMQGAENTGASGSSGESGASAGLATQLGANIGFNLGQIQGAKAISEFTQSAADLRGDAQSAVVKGQNKQATANFVGSIFTTGYNHYK
jgi:hypothetical protein